MLLCPASQKGDGTFHIVGRIDADGFLLGDAYADAVAVLQPAQLLEALGLLERRSLQAKDLINEYNKSVNAKKRKNNKPSDENKNEVENIRTVVDEKPPVEVKFTLALMNKTFDSSIEELKKTFDEKNQLTFKSLDNILVLPINKGTGYYSKYGAVKLRQLITFSKPF